MTDTTPSVVVAPVPALPQEGLKQKFFDWLKQPNTQKGFGLILGGIALCVFAKFPNAESIGATLIAVGLPMIGYDNTTDAIKSQDTANAVAHVAATHRIGKDDLEALAKAVKDA